MVHAPRRLQTHASYSLHNTSRLCLRGPGQALHRPMARRTIQAGRRMSLWGCLSRFRRRKNLCRALQGFRWALTRVLAPRIPHIRRMSLSTIYIDMGREPENTFSEDCNRGGAFHSCLPVPFASGGMPGRPVNKDKALLTMSTEITKPYCQRDRLRLGFCSAMSDRQILNARQSAEIPCIGCSCIDVHKQSCKVCFLARVPAGTRENVV